MKNLNKISGNKLFQIVDKSYCYVEEHLLSKYFKKGVKKQRCYSSK